MATGCGLKGRDKSGHIAHDENLTGARVENLRGINTAIGTGDDHHFGALAFAKFFPLFAFGNPFIGAETGIAFEHV